MDKPQTAYCIEVRNMPLSASYGDVRHAFQGINIRNDGIKLITDTQGNRVGIAYVRFGSFEHKEQALKGQKYVRGSEVEVLHLEESIFEKTSDSFGKSDKPPFGDKSPFGISDKPPFGDKTIFGIADKSPFGVPDKSRQDKIEDVEMDISPTPSSCVLVSDLPPFVKEMDIAKLFQDWKINDLFITSKKEATGMQYYAYVQFARLDDAKLAQSKPLKMGTKSIMIMSIPEEKFEQAKVDHEQMNSGGGSGSGNKSETGASFDCIIMRGLPYQTIDRDILDFFSDVGLVPHRIHMLLNQNGKPAGECFCEFDLCEEAVRATAKNGLPLGKNIPTIELVNRNKMLETLGLVDNNDKMMNNHQQAPLHFSHMQDPRPRFPPMHHPGRFGGMGNFGMRGPPIMGMPPRHMMGPGRHPPVAPPPPLEGFGKPGCVLSLENVPFKADIDEIIDFFGDYNILRDQIIRRYNDKGMPTGDARVAFSSPAEAQRALRELRNFQIRDRTIFMKIA